MKKFLLTTFFFTLLATLTSMAQPYAGFRTGSFVGVHGGLLNPAFLADNRLHYDINLVSFSSTISNDFLKMKNSVIFNPDKFDEDDFEDKYLKRTINGKDKSAYVAIDVLGPSFFAGITKKDAIGFYTRVRGMLNVDGIDEKSAESFLDGIDSTKFPPNEVIFHGKEASVNANMWAEYGFQYARVLYNDNKNVIKAGVTLKLLQGITSAYVNVKNYEYQYLNDDTIMNASGVISYGHTQNQFWTEEDKSANKWEKVGFGIDLGMIYEYRPEYEKYTYDLDGETGFMRKDVEAYKFKLGFSMTDLGTLSYKKYSQSRNSIAVNSLFDQDLYANLDGFQDLDSAINAMPDNNPSADNRKYKMDLPLALNFEADYNFGHGLFVNLNPIIALRTGHSDVTRNHYFTTIALTPRWEKRWFGVYVPIAYNTYIKMKAGISLRLGPVFIGTGDLLSTLSSGYVNSFDFHMGFKIPIPYAKPKDKDKDGVSNKKDLCPESPGPWLTMGCPDRDGDGILDSGDKCPDIKGLKEFEGCPDRDGDKIPDKDDDCPDVAGLKEFRGCPDKDGDGVMDEKDKCPDVPGIKQLDGCPDKDGDGITDLEDNCPDVKGLAMYKGCPDTDGDGIPDNVDKCPEQAGPKENGGCPFKDKDGDGIKDDQDKCPDVAGPAENNGCPYSDRDKDGIPDKDDKCPDLPGVPSNFGCPEIKAEEREILKTAFDNLEFETGKSIIKESSFKSLDELAALMKKKPEFKLLIEGHTDNVGSDASNMTLSKNRSNAVKNYLVKKGVDASRFKVNWFGETKPIDSNDTPEGRQHNRRVEMNIVF